MNDDAKSKPALPKIPLQEEDYASSIGSIKVTSAMPYSFLLGLHEGKEVLAAKEVVRKLVARTARFDGNALEKEFIDRLTAPDLEGISARILQLTGNGTTSGAAVDKLNEKINELAREIKEAALAVGAAARIGLTSGLPPHVLRDITRHPPLTPQMSNGSKSAIELIETRIAERRAAVGQDRIVWAVAASPSGGGFPVSHLRAAGDLVILTGISSKESDRPDEIMQHYSQVNILITDVPASKTMGFVLT